MQKMGKSEKIIFLWCVLLDKTKKTKFIKMEINENIKSILEHWEKINNKISSNILKALRFLSRNKPDLLYLHGSCTCLSLKSPNDIDFIYISRLFNDFTLFQQLMYIQNFFSNKAFNFPLDVIPYSLEEYYSKNRFDFDTYEDLFYPNKLILVYKNERKR